MEHSLYPGWVSTKEFADTGEQTGFPASTVPESGSKEDDASSCDLSDDDDEDAPERGFGNDTIRQVFVVAPGRTDKKRGSSWILLVSTK